MADATSSTSHHASSSIANVDLYQHEGEASTFPSLTPLSHDLTFLSPISAPKFSVDDFLLSRTKAADLNYILSDLRTYSEKLKNELYSIINEDYRDFVSLGSSLKAEAHRIARLGWTAHSNLDDASVDADADDALPQPGLMAPVRDTLLASRSMLKSVQDDIEDCFKRREDATSHKASLELMLQFHDSIVRLEGLLSIQHEKRGKDRRRSSARRPSVLSIGSLAERRPSLVSIPPGSDQEMSDYAMSSEYEDESESEDQGSSDELHKGAGDDSPKRSRRKLLRRLSSGAHHTHHPRSDSMLFSPTRTRASTAIVAATTTTTSGSDSLLGLPQRMARTSAEYSRLRFLHRRLEQENPASYADALSERIDTIRSILRQDLRTVLAALIGPSSLLVHGQTSQKVPSSPELRKYSARPGVVDKSARRMSFTQSLSSKPQAGTTPEGGTNELDNWSQVAEPMEEGGSPETAYWEARFEEQRGWLEMVLSTLNGLTIVRDKSLGEVGGTRRNEAEEAVRDLLVSDWAEKQIVDQPKPSIHSEALKNLPEAAQSQFGEHHAQLQTLLLEQGSSPTNPLTDLYNSILCFVSTTCYQLIEASRELTSTTRIAYSSGNAPETQCDIFTHVIWDTISNQLLTTMGSKIFFVGQTDTFYSNFILTNTFLQHLLSLAPTEESRQSMLKSDTWITFKRRWQLPVYFQMRFREVVTQLETKLVNGLDLHSGGDNDDDNGDNHHEERRCRAATAATIEAIERVWSDGVHIHELSAREWRVTLQLLSRFKTWVEQSCPPELGTSGVGSSNGGSIVHRQIDSVRNNTTTSAVGGASSDGTRTSFDGRNTGSIEISRVSTPQPASDQTLQQHEDESLRLATDILADCLYLRRHVEEVLIDKTILTRISGCGDVLMEEEAGGSKEDLDGLRTDLLGVLDNESFGFIPGLTASVGRWAYTIISPRSAAPLRLLRSFSTPAYRHASIGSGSSSNNNSNTNNGVSAAVQVIHQLFNPLESFLSSNAVAEGIPQHIKRGWAEKILSDAFRRYCNTIETINKNQQSLIRLKKSQGPSSSSSSSSGGGGLLSMFRSTVSSANSAGNTNESRTASAPTVEDSTKSSIIDTNKQALSVFQTKIIQLNLAIDLDNWQPWLTLKHFLESDPDLL